MKKLLSVILFVFAFAITKAQVEVVRSSASNTMVDPNLFARNSFRLPVFPDTTAANASVPRLDSCGSMIYTYRNNTLWKRSCSPKRWEEAGSGVKAGMGMTKSLTGDTLHGGGVVNGIQRYIVPNPFLVAAPFSYMQWVNRPNSDSLSLYGLGTGGRILKNEGYQFISSPYAPAMLSAHRFLAEWELDTANLQYGGIMSFLAQRVLDSTNSKFGPTGTKKPLWMADPGIAITNQFFPTRDTLDLAIWQDGVTGASFHSLAGIGSTVGYNFHVGGDFPYTTGFVATTDLQRQASRTRYRGITGEGVAGFSANYRDWQQTMSSATPPPTKAHYISKISGFTFVGNTDPNTGTDLTKAQIMLRVKEDTVTAFLSKTIWKTTNPVRNAYAFRSEGDSDMVFHQGYTYLGPQLPTHDNGLWPQRRFHLQGDGYVDGSLYFNIAGRLVGGNAIPTFNAPNYLYLVTNSSTDSSTYIYLGTSGGIVKLIARYVNDANTGGVDISSNFQNFAGSGVRMNFINQSGAFEVHHRFTRLKVSLNAIDSIDLVSPLLYAKGIAVTGAKDYMLTMDAAGSITRVDTAGLFGRGANALGYALYPLYAFNDTMIAIDTGAGRPAAKLYVTTRWLVDSLVALATGSSGLIVGTTTIASGTTTRILYNNAGVLGEYTLTGTGTVVAMQTSPSITTSLLTGSTTFALLNTTATTVNAFGATTTLNIGASAATVLNFGGSTSAAEFRYLEPSASGTNYTAFKAQAQAASITYTLPAVVASPGQFLTDAAGNGTLSWATPGGSSFLPTTGTGTAIGAIIGDLDGNTLTISDGGTSYVIDPVVGSHVFAFPVTGGFQASNGANLNFYATTADDGWGMTNEAGMSFVMTVDQDGIIFNDGVGEVVKLDRSDAAVSLYGDEIRFIDATLSGASVGWVWKLADAGTGAGAWVAAASATGWDDMLAVGQTQTSDQVIDMGVGNLLVFSGNETSGLVHVLNSGVGSAFAATANQAGYGIEVTTAGGFNNATQAAAFFYNAPAGTPAAGLGVSLEFKLLPTTGSSPLTSNTLISKWTNPVIATATSQFDITGMDAGATETFMNIQPSGVVRVNNLADTLSTKAYARSLIVAPGITIGTTTITSGTTTRILYDNAGVVGEYTITGTGTVVAMQTSPNFTTPVLGTPTSGTLTNTTGYLWNNLASPTADQALTFAVGFSSTWTNSNTTEDLFTINTSTLTTANQLSLVSTSTTLAAGNEMLNIASSGVNGTNGITATGARISVTNTNATSGSNIGLEVTASGATTLNRAIDAIGDVLIQPAVTNGTINSSGIRISPPSVTTGTVLYISEQFANTLTTGTLFHVSSTSTAKTGTTVTAANISTSGANSTNAVTVTALTVSATNTNATSGTNVALRATASGATTGNIAAIFTGRVAMGGVTSPLSDLDVGSGNIAAGSLTVTTSAGTNTTGNFSTGSTTLVGNNAGAIYQVLASANVNSHVFIGGTGATAVGIGLPGSILNIGAAALVENSSGTHPLFASLIIRAPTITGAAATLTNQYTLYIEGAPAGTATNTGAIWVDAGDVKFDGNLIVGGNTSATGQYSSAAQTVTYGTTTTWDWNLGTNAVVTLTGNITTFTISNAVAGTYATIRMVQDGTGSRLLSALPANSKVINGGAGAIVLSTAASSIDLLTVYYDGTNYYWNYGKNYN